MREAKEIYKYDYENKPLDLDELVNLKKMIKFWPPSWGSRLESELIYFK